MGTKIYTYHLTSSLKYKPFDKIMYSHKTTVCWQKGLPFSETGTTTSQHIL